MKRQRRQQGHGGENDILVTRSARYRDDRRKEIDHILVLKHGRLHLTLDDGAYDVIGPLQAEKKSGFCVGGVTTENVRQNASALVEMRGRGGIDIGQQRRRFPLLAHHRTARQEVIVLPRMSLEGLDGGVRDGREMAGENDVCGSQSFAEQ